MRVLFTRFDLAFDLANEIQRYFAAARDQSATENLSIGSGSEPAECVVIDFSATGAKIYIDPGLELPRQVRLTIKQRNLDLTCVVAHRSGETAGLKFVKDNLAERR